MELNSPLRKSGKFRFAFRENKEAFDVTRNLSPTIDLASPLLRHVNSPGPKAGNFQSPEPNFIEEIVFQCKRLNPDFSSNIDPSNYNLAVMQTLRKAVDLIIDNQRKDWGGEIGQYQEKINELSYQIEELNKKTKGNNDSEKKLALREEKLAIDEIKMSTERKMIQNEKAHVSSMKKHYLQLEIELKHAKEDLKAEKTQNQLKESRIHELFNDSLEKETIIQEMKNNKESEIYKLSALQEQIKAENIKLSKTLEEIDRKTEILKEERQTLEAEKKQLKEQLQQSKDLNEELQQELLFFENNKKEMNSLRVNFEIEQAKIKELKKNLESDKLEILNTEKILANQRSMLQQEIDRFEQEKNDYQIYCERIESGFQEKQEKQECQKLAEINDINSYDISEKQSISERNEREIDTVEYAQNEPGKFNNLDSTLYFPELKRLISEYSTEIFERKLYMQKWCQNLYERETSFDSRLGDIQIICTILERTQLELTEESDEKPDLEPLIEVVKDFLNDIAQKKVELDDEFIRLAELGFENDETRSDFNNKSGEIIVEMLIEFENKAAELQDLDAELQEFRARLESQTQENSEIAEYLKEERIRFEKEKIEKMEEIDLARKGLLELQEKLDNTIEAMNKKETELLTLQQAYDCTSSFTDDLSLSLN